MSSGEEDYDGELGHSSTQLPHATGLNHGGFEDLKSKKRRVQRACDVCRKKKIRCDGAQMPNNRCSNCIAYSYECAYIEAAKKRGPPKGWLRLSFLFSSMATADWDRYVESLENRLEKMEKLLQKLCPDADFVEELGVPIDRDSWANGVPSPEASIPATRRISSAGLRSIPNNPHSLPESASSEPEEEGSFTFFNISNNMSKLGITNIDSRFYGKSSEASLAQNAVEIKRDVSGSQERQLGYDARLPASHRPEFWTISQWELQFAKDEAAKEMEFRWPPQDLIPCLIDLYFKHVNVFFPLLHRPTFDAQVRDNVHRRDIGFGSILMLVCAAGARWSDDPRVLADSSSRHSAGWNYFQQVKLFRKSLVELPSLTDLQMYSLASFYLMGSSIPYSAWTVVGTGLRLAQDVGAHRKKTVGRSSRADEELWKRAFWCLICVDRLSSSLLGRTCAMHDEEFDLEMPLEVDDEYWIDSDPDNGFKQPPDKPSVISSFTKFLELLRIMTIAGRTIYCLNKPRMWMGFVGPQWEQHVVSELDSELNRWISAVSDHLRWDPANSDSMFFAQSASIYSLYYHVQVLIHRPFIPTPKKPSPISFPSLAICANAARSCSHVMDTYRRKSDRLAPWALAGAFTSGVVTLLNLWGVSQTSTSTVEYQSQLGDIHKCMKVLSKVEKNWHIAGRLLDILRELASVGDFPLPQWSPTITSNKREREMEVKSPVIGIHSPQQHASVPRLIVGRSVARSRSQAVPQPQLPSQMVEPIPLNNPVMYTPDYVFGPVPPQPEAATLSPGVRWFPTRAGPNIQATARGQPNPSSPEAFQDSFSVGSAQHAVYPTPPNTTYPQQQILPVVSGMFGGAEQVSLGGLDDGGVAMSGEPFLNEAGSMWSSAPHSFDDWGHYLAAQNRSGFSTGPSGSRPSNSGH